MLAHFRQMLRHERLARAHLYLVGDAATLQRVLDRALLGGVGVVQVRSRSTSRSDALPLLERCREAGVLFIVNDEPVLADAIDADGVHLGQDDMAVAQAR